tara:strand:+ start:30371 stop:31507 length:1137 start_codon:yes stop_codon:yes gene_type:complete
MIIINKVLFLLLIFLNTGCFRYVDIKLSQIKKELDTGCKVESKEYYINGLNTIREKAKIQNKLLSKAVDKEYQLSYNYSHGLLLDLVQATLQMQKEVVSDSHLKFLTNLITINNKNLYSKEEKEEIKKLSEESGKYTLNIVSFSQGNLFANHICDNSTIIGNNYQIATPSLKNTKCQKAYSTFSGDEIVYLLRLFSADILPLKKPNIKYEKLSNKEKIDTLKEKYDKGELTNKDFEETLFSNHEFTNYLNHKKVALDLKKFSKKYHHKNHKEAIKVFLKGVNSESIVKSSTGKKEIYCSDLLKEDIHYLTFSLQSVNKWLGVRIGDKKANYLYIKDGEFISSKIIEDEGSFKMIPYSTEDALKKSLRRPLDNILGLLD